MCIKKMKKKDRARDLIRKNHEVFKCPVCSGLMFMNDSNSLTCNSRHCFDLSKKGYINLLVSNNAPVYSKELFEARHKVCRTGFYEPLIDKLAKIIEQYQKSINRRAINILDAGCGEGSHIYELFKRMKGKAVYNAVGVDISKDSINMAANNNTEIIWCVADLARLPFQNRSFDVILNILSPANYKEFDRILTNDGIQVKVVPGSQYLKELREILRNDGETINYSNNKVINHFSHNLDIMDIQNINYKFAVDEEVLPDCIKMTPLTWGKSTEKFNAILEKDRFLITVDLILIIGIKKK